MSELDSIAKGLVDVLLDETAREDERDDAAMDLGQFNDECVVNALINVAQDFRVDSMVRVSCGASLAVIWIRKDKFDLNSYLNLPSDVKYEIYCSIKNVKSEWINQYNLEWPVIIHENIIQASTSILLDENAKESEKKIAIIHLTESNLDGSKNVLENAARDLKNSLFIHYQCGYALASIWIRDHKFDREVYQNLPIDAKSAVISLLQVKKPRWIKQNNLVHH